MEVSTGVYQLKIPIPDNPLGNTNVYLMRDKNGCTLVDTGWPTQETLDVLIRELGTIAVSLQDITSIVITHDHRDHFGLAGKIKELSNAQIIMHDTEAYYIKEERRRIATQTWGDWLSANGLPEEDRLALRNRNWGEGDDYKWRVEPDRTVQDGDKLAIGCGDIEVIWTPGHSLEHICLYDQARKILFSGDHMLPVITPHVGSDPNSATNPLGNYIDSLKKIEQHDVDLILPGHEHVFKNIGERVQQILEHHEQRVEDLLNVLGSEEKAAYQIASKMTWVDVSGVVLGENLALPQQVGAMGETLAHLEFLQMEGRVERFIKEDVAFFRANMNNVSYT
jgi:glyoxylase-like metal-dependent hydrolase (beta-lactamase superfamily II)